MLKLTFLFLFIFALGVESTLVKEFQDEVPGHEGECVGKDKKFYKLGETMTGDQEPCTRKVCKGTAQPGSVYIEVQKCSKVDTPPGCQLKSDSNKQYPDCCGKVECKHH